MDNFPGNFLTLTETQDGGVVIHILISLYLFAALAIVCDDYFVPALERICEGRNKGRRRGGGERGGEYEQTNERRLD